MASRRKLACATCGAAFTHAGGRGQPPKNCPKHRRGGGAPRDAAGAKRRAAEVQRTRRAAAAEREATPEDETRALQLAAVLSLGVDARTAAALLGMPASTADLQVLEARARVAHPELVAGEIDASARLVGAAIAVLSAELLRQRGALAPRDLANAAQRLGHLRSALTAGRLNASFASINLVIKGPDGQTIDLLPATPAR